MSLIQWNLRGYFSNLPELQLLINEYNPLSICLQETKVRNGNIRIKDYTFIESHYQGALCNAAVLVRKDIPYHTLNFNCNIRHTAVQIFVNKWYTVCSVYLPPNDPIDTGAVENLIHILPEPFLIVGDFNGRHTLWCDSISNTRGRVLERIFYDEPVFILNNAGPTHLDSRTRTESCIDLSICSTSATVDFTWRVDSDLHGSDHFPILVDFNAHNFIERPAKWNFNMANWALFSDLIKTENAGVFNNVNDMVLFFIALILKAAHASIFRSDGRPNKRSVPGGLLNVRQTLGKNKELGQLTGEIKPNQIISVLKELEQLPVEQ